MKRVFCIRGDERTERDIRIFQSHIRDAENSLKKACDCCLILIKARRKQGHASEELGVILSVLHKMVSAIEGFTKIKVQIEPEKPAEKVLKNGKKQGQGSRNPQAWLG